MTVLEQVLARGSWPSKGPFNTWYRDLPTFIQLLEENQGFWPVDMRLKYLNIQVDTRDGAFALYDRENHKIIPDEVVQAICKWKGITK